jgi:hypothetical protein
MELQDELKRFLKRVERKETNLGGHFDPSLTVDYGEPTSELEATPAEDLKESLPFRDEQGHIKHTDERLDAFTAETKEW